MTKHFLTLSDLGADGLQKVLEDAAKLKQGRGTYGHKRLEGQSVVILLEKASTRTRLSFEIGIAELGAHPVCLIAKDTQLGRGEPLSDTARMLSGYAHAVVYRTFGHERVQELADNASIPVINGLSDSYHPCQLLADLQTIQEFSPGDLATKRVAWVGDGNNMAHSWILAAGLTGLDLNIAAPAGYQPDPAILAMGRALGGGEIRVTHDPAEACEGVDVVTTDVWASMGQEAESKARAEAFSGFEVDSELMAKAKSDSIFLHCLPAHRGEEVSAEVIDGPQSRVWAEAENRLHAQKALLLALCSNS
jgi:ornithine carbamoyltransferase